MKISDLICESKTDNSFTHLHKLISGKSSEAHNDFIELVDFIETLRNEFDNDSYHTIMDISSTSQRINKNFVIALLTCTKLYTKGKSYNVNALYKNTKIFDKLSKAQLDSCTDFIDNLEKLDDEVLEKIIPAGKDEYINTSDIDPKIIQCIRKLVNDKTGQTNIRKMSDLCDSMNNRISQNYFKTLEVDEIDINDELDDLTSFLDTVFKTIILQIDSLTSNNKIILQSNIIICDTAHIAYTNLAKYIETIPRLKQKLLKILPADYRYDPQYAIDQQYSCVTPYANNHKKVIDGFESIERQLLQIADKLDLI